MGPEGQGKRTLQAPHQRAIERRSGYNSSSPRSVRVGLEGPAAGAVQPLLAVGGQREATRTRGVQDGHGYA